MPIPPRPSPPGQPAAVPFPPCPALSCMSPPLPHPGSQEGAGMENHRPTHKRLEASPGCPLSRRTGHLLCPQWSANTRPALGQVPSPSPSPACK